jgi:hypothetical protein
MQRYYNTWWKKALILLAFIFLVRETGVADLSLYLSRSQHSISSTVSRSNHSQIDLKAVDYNVGISPLDYTPFYKSRVFQGTIKSGIGEQPPGTDITITYRIELTITGLCSAHKFRELASEQIKQAFAQQASN